MSRLKSKSFRISSAAAKENRAQKRKYEQLLTADAIQRLLTQSLDMHVDSGSKAERLVTDSECTGVV